jgi:hypothetical protein
VVRLLYAIILVAVSVISLLSVSGCTTKKDPPVCATILSISGTALSSNASWQNKPLLAGTSLRNGDIITVGEDSRVVVGSGVAEIVSAIDDAVFSIDSLEGAELRHPVIKLFSGELFCRTLGRVVVAFTPSQSACITPSIQGTQYSVRFEKASQTAVVACMFGILSVKAPGGNTTDVPSCFKLLVKNNATGGDIMQTTEQDYHTIAVCAGIRADSIEQLSFCKQLASEPVTETPNMPPTWKTTPRNECYQGVFFFDTLSAVDPEGETVAYKLLQGPKGMTLDSYTGTLRYKPIKPGLFSMQVSAEDPVGAATTTSYTVSSVNPSAKTKTPPASPKLSRKASAKIKSAQEAPFISAMLDLPSMAEPGDTVVIDASRSGGPDSLRPALSYRFDIDGDDVWDYPASGYGTNASIKHRYHYEGVYAVIAEVLAADGRLSRSEGRLMVRFAPSATIEIRPQLPLANTVCTLDASKSSVSSLVKNTFVSRWDLDNNGSWDFPENGSFTPSPIALKKLDGPGPYRVLLQIKDEAGLTSKAIAEIPITPVFKIILLSLPDTALVDVPFGAACQTSFPPSAIGEFEWDFDGDGKPEVKDEKPLQSHEFDKPGVYKVSCTATARNGSRASAVKSVVAVSKMIKVKAKVEPKQVQAQTPVSFDADIGAQRTKVEQIAWDFDGDNVWDWSSQLSPKTKYAFAKPGVYHPIVRVTSSSKHEWLDTAMVTVTEAVPPRAMAGKNILANKEQTVELSGEGVAPGGAIVLYEWDFDANGAFDWSSEKNGKARHKFIEYGKAVLRVTAENGFSACDTIVVALCSEDMTGVAEGPFCIDKYEYPNKSGQVPVTNVTWAEADTACKKEGKRICTATEWERACMGQNSRDYPQSTSQYATQPCNVLANRDSPNHVSQSGSFADCKSPYGVFDMNGNAGEWTAPEKNGVAPVYGGSWLLPPENAKCSSRLDLNARKGYPYVGFRCCK